MLTDGFLRSNYDFARRFILSECWCNLLFYQINVGKQWEVVLLYYDLKKPLSLCNYASIFILIYFFYILLLK